MTMHRNAKIITYADFGKKTHILFPLFGDHLFMTGTVFLCFRLISVRGGNGVIIISFQALQNSI